MFCILFLTTTTNNNNVRLSVENITPSNWTDLELEAIKVCSPVQFSEIMTVGGPNSLYCGQQARPSLQDIYHIDGSLPTLHHAQAQAQL